MSDVPIIFSAPMVRALLDGRKTMTRRLAATDIEITNDAGSAIVGKVARPSPWRRTQPGDRLWVRESGQLSKDKSLFTYTATPGTCRSLRTPYYPAAHAYKSVPSIHMPRWASRLTLIVTATKIEQLMDCSEADAIAEGVNPHPAPPVGWPPHRAAFEQLWKTLHGEHAWIANPEVVALTFTVHKHNIDALPKADAA